MTGDADHASADTGHCAIGGDDVAPNDIAVIVGDTASAATTSSLQLDTVTQRPDGTIACTYTGKFDAVPANQRRYVIAINQFAQQSFTADELKSGATYYLRTEH
ncbi:hypothetical protein AB4Z09_26190 [Rhodococcus sp. TAF43]|uniref:hypothetical protein n=1 Tax=Rhodococcus sp. TAF43 TaxID=3237483 RepID=UPI003F9628D6